MGPMGRSAESTQQRAAADLGEYLANSAVEVVCVDYFDTLVTRAVSRGEVKTRASTMLVDRLEVELSPDLVLARRREAEAKVSAHAVADGFDPEFDLGRVGRELHQSLEEFGAVSEPEFLDLFQECDLAVELHVQRLNRALVSTIAKRRSTRRQSPIVLISDFYFPGHVFERMLEANRLRHLFDLVVVSCDHRLSKATGRLYDHVLERHRDIVGSDPSRMLMIGDNPISDGTQATARGMATFAVPVEPARPRVVRALSRLSRAVGRR